MLSSLRTRLLAAMLIAVLAALGTMAIFASRATTAEFERSVGGILRYRDPRIDTRIHNIQKYITQHTGEQFVWQGLQRLLEGMQADSKLRFVMADLDGQVYADSTDELVGQRLDLTESKPFAAFLVDGEPILAYFEPEGAPNLVLIQQGFTDSVNRSLFFAILAASALALLLALVLSRSILSPVSALMQAARGMERGDLSQRVHVRGRSELGELAQAFNAMADGLQRLELLRHNMVTDVAHELRTPLTNVCGYLEALQDGLLEPTPQIIHSLHEEALLLSRLVDDLQELALADAGQLRLELQSVDLLPAIEKWFLPFRALAQARQVRLEMDVPAGLSYVLIDPERLHQVLYNLVENALVHTPPGGSITLQARQVGNEIVLNLHDTGDGIAPEHLPFIFERFYRVDKSRARATGGFGLGLSIVKQLVEAQGGRISAMSALNQGTTIQFTLPISPPGSKTSFERSPEPRTLPPEPGQPVQNRLPNAHS